MIKPEKKYPYEPMYIWSEVEQYIFEKYGRKLRDWAGMFYPKHDPKKPYQDFWHYIIDGTEVCNGASFLLTYDPAYPSEEPWIDEILKILMDEGFLGEYGEGEFFASW